MGGTSVCVLSRIHLDGDKVVFVVSLPTMVTILLFHLLVVFGEVNLFWVPPDHPLSPRLGSE